MKNIEGTPVIWLGVTLGEAQPSEMEQYLKDEGYTVKFVEEFRDNCGTPHIIFSLLDNIPSFCIYRVARMDMKWLDDYYENHPNIFPQDIVDKYGLVID